MEDTGREGVKTALRYDKNQFSKLGESDSVSVNKNHRDLSIIHDRISNGKTVNAICLTSMTFDSVLTEAIKGLEHYEMRCLWEISKALSRGVHVHFFSKKTVSQEAKEHFFDVFCFTDAQKAKVTFTSVEDILGINSLDKDLSDYVLYNHRVREIFSRISQKPFSYLECFVLTKKELEISQAFSLPTYWSHEEVEYFKTKSGNRFLLDGVTKMPKGFSDLYTIDDFVGAIKKLKVVLPNVNKFVVKLNDGVSGDGNGFVKLIGNRFNEHSIRQSLIDTNFVSEKMTYTKFFKELSRQGGVVEEFVEGQSKRSPSVQLYLKPNGDFEILSSHEQILDETGSRFLGAIFPASVDHRSQILYEAKKVARALARKKVYGIVGLDFLTVKQNEGNIDTYLIEINLRKGGTTHPFWTVKNALNAKADHEMGAFILENGKSRVYRSNDNLVTLKSRKRSLNKLMDELKVKGILFCPKSKKGAIIHMADGWEPSGKIGAVIIGENQLEAQKIEEILIKATT